MGAVRCDRCHVQGCRPEVREASCGGLRADWCGPCKQVSPIIEELANAHSDKVRFVKMDTNTNPVTPANNYVLGLPTIQVYVGGELVKAFKGAKSKSVLLGAIQEYL